MMQALEKLDVQKPCGREETSAPRASLDKSRRIEFLDVLRGLAALLVFVQHSMETRSGSFLLWTTKYVSIGEMGVVVFFIVSGFVIPVSLEKYNSLSRFWLGRLLRLWPVYLASLAIAVVFDNLNIMGMHQFRDAFHFHPGLVVLGNATMLEQFLGIPVAISAYWTLSLELVFYILCSLLFVFGVLRRTQTWLWVSVAILLLSQVALAGAFHQSLPAGRVGLIVTALFGTLLYRQQSDRNLPQTLLTVLPVLFSVFAVTFWLRSHFYTRPSILSADHSLRATTLCLVMTWISAYLIFLAGFALRARQFPRLLIWLGQISYPLYLFHSMVLALMPTTLPWPAYLLGTLSISLLIAYLIHVLIEKPVERFQRKALSRKPVPAPARVLAMPAA
jgi:peptidoglycan/LPS O-acetylase OafA/YrhL